MGMLSFVLLLFSIAKLEFSGWGKLLSGDLIVIGRLSTKNLAAVQIFKIIIVSNSRLPALRNIYTTQSVRVSIIKE